MKNFIWIAMLLLIVFHQDYWQWDDATLLWGFLPRNLAYHVALSIAASIVWLISVHWCWPLDADSQTDLDGQRSSE